MKHSKEKYVVGWANKHGKCNTQIYGEDENLKLQCVDPIISLKVAKRQAKRIQKVDNHFDYKRAIFKLVLVEVID